MPKHRLSKEAADRGRAKSHEPAARRKASETVKRTRRAKQMAFLELIAQVGVISKAAELYKMSRQQHYDWMICDPEYPALFTDARLRFTDSLKYEATVRGRDGLRVYKFYKGQPIKHPITGEPYFEHVYSDALLLAQLKAHCPEEYSDKHVVNHKEDEFDYDSIPIGPGEPEEAFYDFLQKLKKIRVDQVKVTQVTALSIAQRAAEIKAERKQRPRVESDLGNQNIGRQTGEVT